MAHKHKLGWDIVYINIHNSLAHQTSYTRDGSRNCVRRSRRGILRSRSWDTYQNGARMRSTLQEELDGVAHWAANNNMRLNTTKSREMLIPRGGRWRTEVPPPLAMERVGSLRILGVTIASDLSVSTHVDALLNAEAC